MLNYIWAGLIVTSFVFAGVYDTSDLIQDRYRNGQALTLNLEYPEGFDGDRRFVPVVISVDPARFGDFYGTAAPQPATWEGTLVQTADGRQLRFAANALLPEPLATIQGISRSNDDELQGTVESLAGPVVSVVFEPVRFVKMNAIAAAALGFAETAAEIALGLIGVLALFLGLLKIAEEAGLVRSLVRFVQPVLRPLFPDVPADHPALGMIALNLTANIFGLGNAATPFGIKAMEELQTLNRPFKYIVTCIIMQKNGAGLDTGAALFWDNAKDGLVCIPWENSQMSVVVTVFGTALNVDNLAELD